jgi:hypothetical protein
MTDLDKLCEARRLVSEVQQNCTDVAAKTAILFATSEINTVIAVLKHDLPTEFNPPKDPFNCDVRR